MQASLPPPPTAAKLTHSGSALADFFHSDVASRGEKDKLPPLIVRPFDAAAASYGKESVLGREAATTYS